MKRHILTEKEQTQFALVLGLPVDLVRLAAKGNAEALIQVRRCYMVNGKLEPKRWR